ncbi:MAG: SIS domain-containing protein [Polyangiaceae bacterium]
MLVSSIEVLALDIDGVITDGSVTLGAQGETKGIAFRDLDAIAAARRAGLRIALVTGEKSPLVDAIAARVNADFVVAGAKDKRVGIIQVCDRLAVDAKRICFVGDADRDALAFPSVGLSFAPADASPRARAKASRVLSAKGGQGAVAEVVELLLAARSAQADTGGIEKRLRRIVEDSIAAHHKLLEESLPNLAEVCGLLTETLRAGGKIMFCGNGGSAADAQHIAAELVGRFAIERDAFAAIALTTDTSILTAVGNDWDFRDVFARQVRALARPGDLVVGISTSGRSPNVVRALEAAREKGARTLAFVGRNGGPIAKAADVSFKAPATATARVQELHILAWHGICEIVEASLAAPETLAETGS